MAAKLVRGMAILVIMASILLCSQSAKALEEVAVQESSNKYVDADMEVAESRNQQYASSAQYGMTNDIRGTARANKIGTVGNSQQEIKNPTNTNYKNTGNVVMEKFDPLRESFEKLSQKMENQNPSYETEAKAPERPRYNQEASRNPVTTNNRDNYRPAAPYSDRQQSQPQKTYVVPNKDQTNRYNPNTNDYRNRMQPTLSYGRNTDQNSVNEAVRAGELSAQIMDETEQRMRANNLTQLPTQQPDEMARNLTETSRGAFIVLEATRALRTRLNIKSGETGISLRGTALERTCPAMTTCNKDNRTPFRTMDGSCNNVNQPAWGQAGSPYRRILPNSYSDGVWEPRISKSGYDLPSPRLISASIASDIQAPSSTHTLWVMQYGQFLTHDIALAPQFRRFDDGRNVLCCANGQHVNETGLLHPTCLPVDIPKNDQFYSKFGARCMNFVRTVVAPRADCNFGSAEQMNQNTHYLDSSNVYGSNDETARQLRTFKNGLLKNTPRPGQHYQQQPKPLLPPDLETRINCALPRNVSGVEPPRDVRCFASGDTRVNQHPDLMVTHTVFQRQHNRLATQLAELNPGWDDERLYQEARRILIAQMQHITYKEWLPMIIGREMVEKLGLKTLEYGFSNDYDQNLDISIGNEFAVAAFRFHSTIQGNVHLVNENRKKESSIFLREHFIRTQVIYTPGNVDKFLIGLSTQPMQQYDSHFSEEVTNHLFAPPGQGFGGDLVSINMQRGRDHGAQGYNAYREMCGLPRARNFKELLDVIPSTIVEKFEQLYDTVDDIDLFIGGVSEKPVSGGITGPTFQCMVADQFMRLKRGDRYFYDLEGQPGSFTEEQLNEIRTISLARLVCDNSDVNSIQPSAFRTESDNGNSIVDCADSKAIPQMNLLPWKDAAYDRRENRVANQFYPRKY